MTNTQKLERILNHLMEQRGLLICYRIESNEQGLFVRKSTTRQPNPSERQKFERQVLPILNAICQIKARVINVGNVPVTLRAMTDINEEALNLKYNELFPLPPCPTDIQEKTWNRIPRVIKEHWGKLGALMQTHIDKCVNYPINPEQYDETQLGEDYLSPVSMQFPNIPVMFPDDEGTDRIYDLEKDILNLKVGEDGKIGNPATRARFTLAEIIPIPSTVVDQLRSKAKEAMLQDMAANPLKTFGKRH